MNTASPTQATFGQTIDQSVPATSSPAPELNHSQPPQQRPAQPPQQKADSGAQQPHSAWQESELIPGQFKPVPEEVILEWQAASRPFKKRNRQFFSTVAIITLLISLILFFAGQFLPIAVVISVAFLAYVLSSVPPDNVTNKLTTYGIRHDENLYYWEEMGRFWFDERHGEDVLHIEIARFPGRLTLLLGKQSKDQMTQMLSEVLLNEKPKDTFYDKTASWLQEKIPLDTA